MRSLVTEPIIVAPEKCHLGVDVMKVIGRRLSSSMVQNILFIVPPVKTAKPLVFDLLSVLQDGVDRGSSRTVGGNCWQHCLVNLLLIIASQKEDHIFTNNLKWVVWSTDKVRNEVHQPVAGEELAAAHVLHHPADQVGEGSDQLDRTVHVVNKGNRGKQNSQLNFVRPSRVHRVHCHVGGRSHRVAHIVDLFFTGVVHHKVELRRQVVLCHLVPRELPEVVVVGVKSHVLPAVMVASIIAKPNVIPLCSKTESHVLCVD